MNTIAALKNQTQPQKAVATQPNVSAGMTTLQGFELAQRAAKLLASSTLVPQAYRDNLPNCVVALNMAQRMQADPLMIMQNLYIVHGTPAWSAQFLIASFNQCGRFGSITYEFSGEKNTDTWGCRASAIERETGNRIDGAEVTIALAKSEGWYQKKGSKWQTMPEQMLRYRAAAWMIRANAPDLAMGFQTADEVHDVYDATPSHDGTFSVADLNADPDGVVIDDSPLAPTHAELIQQIEQAQSASELARLDSIAQDWAGTDDEHMAIEDAILSAGARIDQVLGATR